MDKIMNERIEVQKDVKEITGGKSKIQETFIGGVKMKKKLLMVILFCFGVAGIASAEEVINIDLNGYGDDTPYSGTAVYDDGINQWNVYYGNWGLPMGSPRSANLAKSNEPCQPGTYAAAVWIGDPGVDHNYISGSALMDDGFINNPAIAGDPNIRLWGTGGYGGTFDIYVYGSEAGSFTLTRGSVTIGSNSVTGGVAAGEFVEGGNYVVFTGVNIANDPNYVLVKYSNVINGIQLIKQKTPVAVQDGTQISVIDYDVAFDTNRRSGEQTYFGPDTFFDAGYTDLFFLSYLDAGEYLEYDVTMDDVNEGEYNIYALVDTRNVMATYMNIYFNDMFLGAVEAAYTGDPFISSTNPVTVNIFNSTEIQTLKCEITGISAHNIAGFQFEYVGPINMPDCNEVYRYGFEYAGDFNKDCKVDYKDLDILSQQWLSCIDPNENNCP
ncbi:MAG: hypothetical protein WC496_11330 [Phycisphaerae bacterium]|jgi:hypothetical protein